MNTVYDVAVIGGGVIGGQILRELSRYQLKICLLEKQNDVSMGASRANTGIVHGGFDALPNSNKAKFNVLGAKMMPQVANELGVKYKNNGSLVVAFSDDDLITLDSLYERGIQNDVSGLKILTADQLLLIEPNVSKNAKGALLCESAGIICPYELTIASIGNAMDNGAQLFTNFEVVKIEKNDYFTVTSKDGKSIKANYLINASGMFADKVANMIGDYSFTIGARKGEYMLIDKCHSDLFNHTLFFCPKKEGKGIVVTNTVDGNLLLGPTAVEIEDKEDISTTAEGLSFVKDKATLMSDKIPFYDVITSFTGLRAFSNKHDFIIDVSEKDSNFINVAGIESPGLTASPAIAKYVIELLSKKLLLSLKPHFNPIRKADYFFKNLSVEQKNEIIKSNSDYGQIICRCEEITLGEIKRAINENPRATTVDAIKRRTRAGMGRCQGGFCQPTIVKIIADELGLELESVVKGNQNSNILLGKTK